MLYGRNVPHRPDESVGDVGNSMGVTSGRGASEDGRQQFDRMGGSQWHGPIPSPIGPPGMGQGQPTYPTDRSPMAGYVHSPPIMQQPAPSAPAWQMQCEEYPTNMTPYWGHPGPMVNYGSYPGVSIATQPRGYIHQHVLAQGASGAYRGLPHLGSRCQTPVVTAPQPSWSLHEFHDQLGMAVNHNNQGTVPVPQGILTYGAIASVSGDVFAQIPGINAPLTRKLTMQAPDQNSGDVFAQIPGTNAPLTRKLTMQAPDQNIQLPIWGGITHDLNVQYETHLSPVKTSHAQTQHSRKGRQGDEVQQHGSDGSPQAAETPQCQTASGTNASVVRSENIHTPTTSANASVVAEETTPMHVTNIDETFAMRETVSMTVMNVSEPTAAGTFHLSTTHIEGMNAIMPRATVGANAPVVDTGVSRSLISPGIHTLHVSNNPIQSLVSHVDPSNTSRVPGFPQGAGSVSSPREKRLSYKPENYDGTSDWADFFRHFEMVSAWKGWSVDEKAVQYHTFNCHSTTSLGRLVCSTSLMTSLIRSVGGLSKCFQGL